MIYLLLAAIVPLVTASPQYEYFSQAFGRQSVHAHFSNPQALAFSQNRHTESFASQPSQYLACSSYDSFDEATDALTALVGATSFHPIFISEETSLTCFVVAPDAEFVAPTTSLWEIFTPIPANMKIAESRMSLLTSVQSGEVDWTSLLLEVQYGIGNGLGVDGLDLLSYSHSLIEDLSRTSTHALHTLSSFAPSSTIWTKFHYTVQQRQQTACAFNRLKVEAGKYTMKIDNLASIASADHVCIASVVAALALHPRAIHINIQPKNKVANDFVSHTIQVGLNGGLEDYNSWGVTGKGVVVGVADTGVDELSCFFANNDMSLVQRSSYGAYYTDHTKRKVVQYVPYGDNADTDGHGTHVCGTIAGFNDGSDYNGVAPDAKIAFYDIHYGTDEYLYVPNLNDEVFPAASQAGASIHSNSWGASVNECSSECVDVDEYLYKNKDFLALFAAGNDGPSLGSIIRPAVAKNGLAVGALGTAHGAGGNSLAWFTSKGPTFDGRYGVDVVTQGYATISADVSLDGNPSCEVVGMSGTSMATPAVAGAAALVMEYFSDPTKWYTKCRNDYNKCKPFTPSGIIMKTVLMHAGQDIGGGYAYPGVEQGFGRIDLSTVLTSDFTHPDLDLFLKDFKLNSKDDKYFRVDVASSSVPLKVTIGWMDVPNVNYANKQLLNDIDLMVMSSSGEVFYGNNHMDTLNNAEMVLINDPVPGMYYVIIRAKKFVERKQRLAVVITSHGTVQGTKTIPPIPTPAPTPKPTKKPFKPFYPWR